MQIYDPIKKKYVDSNEIGIDQKKLNLLQIFTLQAVYDKTKEEITRLTQENNLLRTQLDRNVLAIKTMKENIDARNLAMYNCANNNKTNFTNYNTCIRLLGSS